MPALQFLALEDTQLTDAGLEALAPLLSGPLTSLRQLGFGSGLTAAGLRTIVQALADGHLRKLTTLYLQNNTMLADEGACVLAGAIAERGRIIDPYASTATVWLNHGVEADSDLFDSDLHIWCQEQKSSPS